MHKPIEGVSRQTLERFAARARRAAGLAGRVDVLLASSNHVRRLNRRFRGKDKPTDVLSFPPPPELWPELPSRVGGSKSRATRLPGCCGDIVISSEIAAANARRYGHPTAQELKILILHGMLHLAGYDHERDEGKMARKEERLRQQLKLSAGLIHRTNAALGRAASRRRR